MFRKRENCGKSKSVHFGTIRDLHNDLRYFGGFSVGTMNKRRNRNPSHALLSGIATYTLKERFT